MTIIHDSKNSLSEQDITDLEEKLNLVLPKDYRAFLKENNGGYPEPDGFDFMDGSDGSSVDKFLEVNNSKDESIIEYYLSYKKRIPEDFLPIAKDPGGNIILIKANSEDSQIYFWDHENEAEEGESPGMGNMHLIASSLQEFLDNLYEIEV